MNTLNLLQERDLPPNQLAFFPLNGSPVHFGDLQARAVSAREKLRLFGVDQGDSVLLADSVSGDFYAVVMAILSLGATVILVEPHLPLVEIEGIISKLNPKVMVASLLGRAWGIRVKSIRAIPHWISAHALCGSGKSGTLSVASVRPDFPGIITFTSGTTGKAKGVVRTHAGLTAQNHSIRKAADFDRFKKPDLAIFANLVLANLGMGRGTLFVPPQWKKEHLLKLNSLPMDLQPETLSCGPAFLSRFLRLDHLPSLASIHVGGALTDCTVFEEAFRRFPSSTRFLHVYGSTEAEPVAFADARMVVDQSRERGFIQTLALGKAVSEISMDTAEEGLWVTGPHVCPYYIGNDQENQRTKKRDDQGNVWHFMGDRVDQDRDGLWYMGRSFQSKEDFLLEQRIYASLQRTNCFIERNASGAVELYGERIHDLRSRLMREFPEISHVKETKMVRDRRHRARIDRRASR
jgi:acyl-coenzyme A synthetase/AMP-(fatty) acid ligase